MVKKNFKQVSHEIMFDRIELGTYLIASGLMGKKITFLRVQPKIIKTELRILKKMGIKIKLIQKRNSITVLKSEEIKTINIKTEPYPGFPTDLQAQIIVLMTKAKGISTIKENIFEKRFMHIPELKRMGAKINVRNNKAYVEGPINLSGAEVMATDLRASVSLVLAGLVASNKTIIIGFIIWTEVMKI